ncbi:MAG: hypothetical protein ACYDAC_01535 [Candidatus Dormibacteria bacterium]
MLLLLLSACGQAKFRGPSRLPANLTPSSLGSLMLVSEVQQAAQAVKTAGIDSLAQSGEAWFIKDGTYLQGSIQIWLLKSDVRVDDPAVLKGMDDGIGGQLFMRSHLVTDQVIWVKELIDQRVYMWFPPGANAIELVVLRNQFAPYEDLIRALVDYQHGRTPKPFTVPPPASGSSTDTVSTAGNAPAGSASTTSGTPSASPTPAPRAAANTR